jgi:nucleoside-diphosphate-sugar epimerase
MKTIFLTGSKGFIGSHLLPILEQLGYRVICGARNQTPPIPVEYIVHLAGTTTTSDSFIPELFDNNIVYAQRIMACNARIIYATSTSAAELSNPYAYTKRYIEYLGDKHGNATGLRFFNVYGSGNNKGIVKRALECAKTGEKLDLYGGDNIRDFIYIDNAVTAIINALDSKEKIIEVGTGDGMTVFEAITYIQFKTKSYFPINWMAGVKTDMKVSIASPGIGGCLSFEEGITKMLNHGII